MHLSSYDRVVCLVVDHRFNQESHRIREMLAFFNVKSERLQFFLDGDGQTLPSNLYSQVTTAVPPEWHHGKGAYAHFMAMKRVVQQAKDDGIETLLWVEDDCTFIPDSYRIIKEATAQLASLPPWDLLYYGANHTWAKTVELAPNVLKLSGSYTTHCVGIRSTIFDRLLALPPVHVIDNVIANTLHHSANCYAIWPNVALQKPGYSHISNCEVDYNEYFKSKGANWL